MLTRRQFLKSAAIAGAGTLVPWSPILQRALAAPPVGTPKVPQFVDPLPAAIPVLTPNTSTYSGADYYEITMKAGSWKFHSKFAGAATTWGYWGTGPSAGANGPIGLGYLGPTIEARQGRPVVVRYFNELPSTNAAFPVAAAIDPTIMGADLAPGRAIPHLHGGFTPPQFDGHPDGWFSPKGETGEHYDSLADVPESQAVYWYSNNQPAAMLWYHDHARGITRLNAYVGLAALYFIRDDQDTGQPGNPLRLPAAPYEVPLVIQDKQFNADGTLFYPTVGVTPTHPIWVPEFFGDTPVINATAYPNQVVEPRRYRYRMVNGSQARFYNLSFGYTMPNGTTARLPFHVIGMEQSLLPAPAAMNQLLLAPGERADIIVDFSKVPFGTSVLMKNNAKTPYPGGGGRPAGPAINNLMQFQVTTKLKGTDNTLDPALGQLTLPALAGSLIPDISNTTTKRQIIMKEKMDPVAMAPIEVKLNERYFDDPVEEKPKAGTTEVWQFVNLTVDAHPMHMHLVKFQVVNRQPFNSAQFTTDYMAWVQNGRSGPAPDVNGLSSLGTPYLTGAVVAPLPEESAWKDTAKSYPGEVLRVVARFDLPAMTETPAEYVYHCHILEHEENDMMRPFQVV